MSIASEITRLSTNVSDTLSAIEEMGGEVPERATSNDMAAAARTIPVGAKIDDTTPSANTTYSSEKIEQRLDEIELKPGPQGPAGSDGKDYVLTEADKQEIAGMVEVSGGGSADGIGYAGISQIGDRKAYSPIANSTALNERARKVSAYVQEASEAAEIASTAGELAHECSITGTTPYGTLCITWVENVDGTNMDVPNYLGQTCVKGRVFGDGSTPSFPKEAPKYSGEVCVIAQMGDEATNTLTGETFTIPGGTGYQTSIDNKCLLGYVPSYAQLRGMTCELNTTGGLHAASRQTWTLTIDGVIGEYVYSRLPAELRGAELHPSNQVAKINNVYYRADVVPSNGFVVCSSTDLVNWTYLGHATLPDGYDDHSTIEACCGTKGNRLYVAIRQETDSACLYICKMNTDWITVNSIAVLPDCGSKPCFSDQVTIGGVKGFFLATAPVDRYSCRVYWIPDEFYMRHIIPAFEIHGRSCNYPYIVATGVTPHALLLAGTNGAQGDKEGVQVSPILLYYDSLTADLPAAETEVAMMPDGTVRTFGSLYDVGYVQDGSTDGDAGGDSSDGASSTFIGEKIASGTLIDDGTNTVFDIELPKSLREYNALYIQVEPGNSTASIATLSMGTGAVAGGNRFLASASSTYRVGQFFLMNFKDNKCILGGCWSANFSSTQISFASAGNMHTVPDSNILRLTMDTAVALNGRYMVYEIM